MPISKTVTEQMGRGSWVRRMFEEGAQIKRERGAENVFDFSIGNPDVEPPARVLEVLRKIVSDPRPGRHGYMPNAGYPQVRQAVAARLCRDTGVPFTAEDILMTTGAAGACSVIMKAILDPGDEVIVLLPFFPEYVFYVENQGGKVVKVDTDANFLPDIDRIAAAITPRTRAIMLNTPNNPTGRIYPEKVLRDLNTVLKRAGHPILVISDEPYKTLVYDGNRQAEVASLIDNAVVCYSWSKSQGLPGERIGYLALSPRLPDLQELRDACTFSNRVLGFVNAPAIWQWVVLETGDEMIDIQAYQHKRNILCDALEAIGYEVTRPEGTFYIFLKTPIPDDIAFVRALAQQGVLAVPGTGFGRAGYMRLSLTVPLDVVERSIAGFERAFRSLPRA
jgi:aspartate aminotransferase